MMRPTATVHPLDFSQLSGTDFERLVFAFLWRRWPWSQLDWYGQLGDDQGRDIWGYRENDWGAPELVVVACANWQRLTVTKAKGDIDKIVAGPRGCPMHLIFVAGGKVSGDLKTRVTDYARAAGISKAEVWSGSEFEELLRHHAESVLRRFLGGEVLPDESLALRNFVAATPPDEQETLRMLGRLFDRPAFTTPFHMESSLSGFRRAISDTIEAINTGIYRTRDGTIISRLPSKSDFGPKIKDQLDNITRQLNGLRMAFDSYLRSGAVWPCTCGKPDCPVFGLRPEAAHDLNNRRECILNTVRQVVPGFDVVPEPW
jgi:hypothetical protein